jgi:hypothetical protein
MRRWLGWALLFGLALANPYAALVVTPHGEQIFDLATGVTTLPNGGEVAAREAGVVLTGQRLRFQQGVFVEAEGAKVAARAFTLSAPSIFLDIAQQSLSAGGGVVYQSPELTIRAESLLIDLAQEQAVLSGVLSTGEPRLEAATLLVAHNLGAALLVGPYRYQDGLLTLSSSEAGDLLELRWSTTAEDLSFTASTDISAELLARYGPD